MLLLHGFPRTFRQVPTLFSVSPAASVTLTLGKCSQNIYWVSEWVFSLGMRKIILNIQFLCYGGKGPVLCTASLDTTTGGGANYSEGLASIGSQTEWAALEALILLFLETIKQSPDALLTEMLYLWGWSWMRYLYLQGPWIEDDLQIFFNHTYLISN